MISAYKTAINNSYAIANMSTNNYNPTWNFGGLIGYAELSSVNNSYATAVIRGGPNPSGGLIGYAIYTNISNSYTTSGLDIGGYISSGYQVGGFVGHGVSVSVTNSSSTVTYDLSYHGGSYIGGFIGEAEHSNVSNCSAAADVAGYQYIGGLIGYGDSVIVANSSAAGSANSSQMFEAYCGGLIGYANYSNISGCFSSANVNVNGYGYDGGGLVGMLAYSTIVNSSTTGNITGESYLGGLVGTAQSSTIINSSSTANLSAYDDVGGLVGLLTYSTLTGSYSSGNETAVGTYTGHPNGAGGLVGAALNSSVSGSYAIYNARSPNAAGGLVGVLQSSNVSASNATGRIIGSTPAGGLIGYATGSNIAYSSANSNLSSGSSFGGLVGIMYYTNVTYSTASGNIRGSYSGGLVGQEFSNSIIRFSNASANVGVNVYSVYEGGIVGEMWSGSSVRDSIGFGNVTGSGAGGIAGGTSYSTITNCTTAANVNGSSDAGCIIGTGSRTNVSNCSATPACTLSGTYYVGGIAGALDASSIVNTSYSTINVTGTGDVGGLIGRFDGNMTGCNATGNINGGSTAGGLIGGSGGIVLDSFATGNVNGSDHVGGLIGDSGGIVSNSFATGNVTGGDYTGGLIGNSVTNINNSYATGNVTGGDYTGGLIGDTGYYFDYFAYYYGHIIFYIWPLITDSYATGNVAGGDYTGGLIGSDDTGNITDCFASGNVAGGDYTGGFIGQLQNTLILALPYPIDPGIVADSFASGSVTGSGQRTGGFAGAASDVGIINSFATGFVNAGYPSGGLVGEGSGALTFTNSRWDVCRTMARRCVGNFCSTPDGCFPENYNRSPDSGYFYNFANEPLASYSYPPWDASCSASGYPTLVSQHASSCDTNPAPACLTDTWGGVTLAYTGSDVSVNRSDTFGANFSVSCADGYCGNVSVLLDPIKTTKPHIAMYILSTDVSNYTSTSTSPAFATGTFTDLGMGDDDCQAVSLPFTFNFYGDSKSTIYISSNGWISFDDPFCSAIPSGLGSAGSGIYLWAGDMNPSSSGNVSYYSSSGYFVVQYHDVPQYGLSDIHTMQLVLYPDGRINVLYGQMDSVNAAGTFYNDSLYTPIGAATGTGFLLFPAPSVHMLDWINVSEASVGLDYNVTCQAGATTNATAVYFTVTDPSSSEVVDNALGAQTGSVWSSPVFAATSNGTWNCEANATDGLGNLPQLYLTFTVGVKDVVPEGSGTPFYVTWRNPIEPDELACLGNLANLAACGVNYTVNATGTARWIFFANATETDNWVMVGSDISYCNVSDSGLFNVTINPRSGVVPPVVDFTAPTPANGTGTISALINVSVNEDVVACTLFYDGGTLFMNVHDAGAATSAEVVFAASQGEYTYFVTCYDASLTPGSTANRTIIMLQQEEKKTALPQLALSLNSSCGGNTVTVTSNGQPVGGASVSINDATNTTDSLGSVQFPGCGINVTLHARASGYQSADKLASLVDCGACAPAPIQCDCGIVRDGQCMHYACCSDSQCGQNQTCVDHACGGGGQPVCTAPSCCRSDADCGQAERCGIPAGAQTGQCIPVVGCGAIDNHVLVVQWQCGDLQACPPCGSGYSCISHQCIRGSIRAPSNLYVGSNTTIHAEINNVSCANCEIEITDPAGRNFTVTTNASGDVSFPLNQEGVYKATLVKNQMPLSSVAITSLRPPSVISAVPVTLIESKDVPCLLAVLIVLLLLFVLYMRWRTGKWGIPGLPAEGPKPKA
jgi:hypothetical protein